jgi:hypothetical protein
VSDTGTEAAPSAAAERPIDRPLLAESKLYAVPYRAYADMTPRERAAVKARWAKTMRTEAARRGLDPDEFLAMTEDARAQARKEHPERVRPPRPPRAARHVNDEAPPEDDEEEPAPRPTRRQSAPVAEMYDEGLADGEPHSPMDEVPATEDDPKMRSHATLGEVRPTDNEDLVGWSNPKNLRDVYARYSIGDGQHFIRVERVDPKVWQQIPCAGYLGEIREQISEPEFHGYYGGRVYALTVYGPDPKGRRDPSTGLPVIKAKTEPFRYTVPLLPPNLAVLPGTNPSKQPQQKQGETRMHPFMGAMGTMGTMGSMPATPADANMFKTSIDFMNEQLKRGDRERDELRQQVLQGGGAKEALAAVTDVQKAAIDAATKSAEARERALTDQLAQERERARRLEEKIDRLAEQQQGNRGDPVEGAARLMQISNPGKSAEDQVVRMRESHKEEMDRLRDGHKEAISALKERHDDELKRSRERLDDVEKQSRAKLDDLERRMREREKELRDQMDQQRRDEREAADRRVAETITRFEDRIKDLREQHNRELRMQEGQHVTRTDTTKSAWEMQIANLKDKIVRLEEELAQAKEDAEDSKDPVKVMEKAKQTAEAMGFKKDENEPQGAWERFMATAGMGLGKAFESIDTWLPKALAAREGAAAQAAAAAPATRMLPNGQPMPQQQPQRPMQRPPQRRQVAWATTGGVPVANQTPVMPAEPVAQAQPVQAQPTPMAQPSAVVEPVQAQAPAQAPPQPEPQQQHAPSNGQDSVNALYGSIFPDEVIVQFKAEVERAITAGVPPDAFADRFVAAFPQPSALLVQAHKPEDFVEIVKKMPAGMESVISRRDGKRWVEKLWQAVVQRHQSAAQAQQGAQA